MWDPDLYHRYAGERSRPFTELLARVRAGRPRAVVDLGCGTGELTATLAGRWPGARVTGLDSSPAMIDRARRLGAPVTFRVGDLRGFTPGRHDDVLVTNAALQWVPQHRDLLVRWVRALPPGAELAVQVPGNVAAPSHAALRAVARGAPFATALAGVLRDDPVDDAAGYAALLTGAGAAVDAWETVYVHLLAAGTGDHPVLRWMEGAALRPVRAALDDAGWAAFRTALGERLAQAYPARHGVVAFPFRRVFVVARTPSEDR